MTAHLESDCDTDLLERHAAYEAEITSALLDETCEERAERLELVELAQEMILTAFRASTEEHNS